MAAWIYPLFPPDQGSRGRVPRAQGATRRMAWHLFVDIAAKP